MFTGRTHRMLTLTPTVSLSAYTAKDNMGGKLSFLGAGNTDGVASSGVVRSAVLGNAAATALVNTVRLFLFDSDPLSSTFTDAAALDIDDADLSKVVGSIAFTVALYGDQGVDNTVGGFGDLYIPYDLGSGTTLYGALQVVGAEDLVADTDITIRLGVQLD